MGEVWKKVEGWPYAVDSEGQQVRRTQNAPGTWAGRVLKNQTDKDGYLWIVLCHDRKRLPIRLSHVVAEAFIGPRPSPEHGTNHKDGNKQNNRPGNLEWVTSLENIRHAVETGLRRPRVGSRCANAKLNEAKVLKIRGLYSGGGCTEETLSVMFGVTRGAINAILRFKNWRLAGGPRVSKEEKQHRKRLAMLGNTHTLGRRFA